MKSILPAIAIATSGLLGLASFGAHAADGTISITGTLSNTTCSINGKASGTAADMSVTLPTVSAGALSTAGAVAGTSGPTGITMALTGCTGAATKAVATFENGSTVDQTNGYLTNQALSSPATKVEVRLLNASMQPINIVTGLNNDIAGNGATITTGSANLNYFAQYYATGKATAGPVSTSVQYTMQYQ
ncbi:fimbrial protein [Paraburkholderia sediminicola]|uniref:fimbrial protein n=1 Tax=Paraburkholderia sediminicola TaxID=458836 RepID=UPI0038BD2880